MGLSQNRLALVERYMIDAEEAEGRSQSAAEKAEELALATTEERMRLDTPRPRRGAEELAVSVTTSEPDVFENQFARSRAKQEARAREALAKSERRAARRAARVVAALEKREARERKALAKAAVKREAREREARARSIFRQ